jgi:hypothetical protein
MPSHFGSLKTEPVKDEKIISGTFTAVLFGARYSEDIETVAFLDVEGDDYTFEPYAPVYDYSVKDNLTAEEALHDALSFVNWHHAYIQTKIKKVKDNQGRTLGYELRPLYSSLKYGFSDVLNINYSLKENRVVIYIRLKPFIRKDPDRNLKNIDD